jgi:hypothetical protein
MTTKLPEEGDEKTKVQVLHSAPASDREPTAVRLTHERPMSRLLRFWPLWVGIGLLAVLLVWGVRYHGGVLGPTAVTRKLETVSALRVSLLKSVESEKRAVMADTDEASLEYAEESRRASEAVEVERNRLAELIRLHPSPDEQVLLAQFDEAWEQMRSLDRQILALAVQNTNLKASALSFGKASDALHRFRTPMERIMRDSDSIRVVRLASEALAALLTVQALHAPHIASADDREMTRIEQAIAEIEETVRRCLDQLTPLLPAGTGKRNDVIQAAAAFSEYQAFTRAILELSRQNTNVTSFEMSLSRKMKLTAQCDVILGKLQEAFKAREYKATR